MKIDDTKVSEAIISRYYKKLVSSLELGVALVGGGPSNLVCGIILAENGIKAAVFESKLAPGGGMWGGGMMFNEIVVQESALKLLEKVGIEYREHSAGYFTADSVESASTLISKCIKAGTEIFNLVKVVDVMFREEKARNVVSGVVLQWMPVEQVNLHVDPLTIKANYVVDGTGHPAEVCSIVSRKLDATLATRTGKIVGEMPMWAARGEKLTLDNTGEIYPGLFVTGMAANASKGAPRMGPIFGGMLLSGEKVANELIKRIRV